MGGAPALAGSGRGAPGLRLESNRHRHEGGRHRSPDRRQCRGRHLDTRLADDGRRGRIESIGYMEALGSSGLQAGDSVTLNGVFAVPPLPRRADAKRTLDLDAAEHVARHIEAGGVTRFLYGGNAFLYHATLGEFEMLAEWLGSFAAPRWPLPSIGPSFGHALDQARILRAHRFPAVMMLPCGDPRDARGLEAGYRDIAGA